MHGIIYRHIGRTGLGWIDGQKSPVFRRGKPGNPIFTRATAGNDITYDWYVEEWIRWAGLSYSTRDHNMADMTEQELLHHRLEDAALQLSVFSGVSVSPETLDHPPRQILLDAHGLHMLLMNDIFSYDRDKGMYGWTS